MVPSFFWPSTEVPSFVAIEHQKVSFPHDIQTSAFCNFCSCQRGVYPMERIGHFSIKIKMLFSGGFFSATHTPVPWKKKKKETLVLIQGSRCLYVFIYFDIYSVCCQAICLPGCIPEILKTYMAKPQRSKTCVLGTLCSTLGLSLRGFLWKELHKSSYCPAHILRNVLGGDQAPGEESIQGGVLPLCSVRGLYLKPSCSTQPAICSSGHLPPLLFSHFIRVFLLFLPLKHRE